MERMSPVEFKQWLESRTRDFAVATLKLLDALPKRNSTQIVAFQLGKCASSVGANYREANRAESGVDFGHKIQIAMKEASESSYWFEVLAGLYPMHQKIKDLGGEAVEIRNLFQSISSSVRRKKRQSVKRISEQSTTLNQTINQSKSNNQPI